MTMQTTAAIGTRTIARHTDPVTIRLRARDVISSSLSVSRRISRNVGWETFRRADPPGEPLVC